MVDAALHNYVKENLARGVRPDAIRQVLKRTGYTDQEINAAFERAWKKPGWRERIEAKFKQFFVQARLFWSRALQKFHKKPSSQPVRTFARFRYATQRPSKPGFFDRILANDVIRKYGKYAVWAVIVILLIWVVMVYRVKPPVVIFIDNSTGQYAEGSVQLNGVFIGDTKGTFNKLPKDFCRKRSVLELVTKEGPISWDTDATDCKNQRLVLVVRIIPVKEQKFFVSFEFMTEAGEMLNGTLLLDGVDKGRVYGTYDIYQGECRVIGMVNLTQINNAGVPYGYADWIHDPVLCDNDIIRFKVRTYSVPVVEPKPVQPNVTLPTLNNTDVLRKINMALERATAYCKNFCTNASECTSEKKVMFCTQYPDKLDLNGNGLYTDFVKNVFGDFGVCESRFYCSQIMSCPCEEILDFDSCIGLLCNQYKDQGMDPEAATEALREQLQEGECQSDASYDSTGSWWNWYVSQNKLACSG
jgi:hypothetical protein